jgi:hypothetical protein
MQPQIDSAAEKIKAAEKNGLNVLGCSRQCNVAVVASRLLNAAKENNNGKGEKKNGKDETAKTTTKEQAIPWLT